MRAPERLPLMHVVASPAALSAAEWPDGAIVLRIAPDEVLAMSSGSPSLADDPHAIELRDSAFSGLWLEAAEAEELLARFCEWELPADRPAFAQGALAGLPVKLWLERDRVLILVPAAYADDLAERLS